MLFGRTGLKSCKPVTVFPPSTEEFGFVSKPSTESTAERRFWRWLHLAAEKYTGRFAAAPSYKDIVDQYIRFSEITSEKEKQYGRTQQAIDAIFETCMEEGILVPFLESRKKEVRDIMMTLFHEQRIRKSMTVRFGRKVVRKAAGMRRMLLLSR